MSKSVLQDALRLAPHDISGLKGTAITGSAQTFDPAGRGVLCETAGTVTGKLVSDTADVTYTLTAGINDLAFKSITSVGGGFVGKVLQ